MSAFEQAFAESFIMHTFVKNEKNDDEKFMRMLYGRKKIDGKVTKVTSMPKHEDYHDLPKSSDSLRLFERMGGY